MRRFGKTQNAARNLYDQLKAVRSEKTFVLCLDNGGSVSFTAKYNPPRDYTDIYIDEAARITPEAFKSLYEGRWEPDTPHCFYIKETHFQDKPPEGVIHSVCEPIKGVTVTPQPTCEFTVREGHERHALLKKVCEEGGTLTIECYTLGTRWFWKGVTPELLPCGSVRVDCATAVFWERKDDEVTS